MVYSKKELAVIALASIDGLEYRHETKLLNIHKDPSMLFTGKVDAEIYLKDKLGEAKAKTVLMSLTCDYAEWVVKNLEKKGVVAVTIYSDGYPERLKNIDSPPLVLYAKGDISLLNAKNTFAAVGSRKTLPYAEGLLKDVCKTLTAAGITVVTGSASGADKAALISSADSGKIISVIAGGIDHIYPDCNRSLIERISKNGLVISEQPPSVVPTFWMFPVRNRIIAGLSDAVLIASGDKSSGARHTADFALNYGKSLFAFPYSVGIKSGELCNELIKNGAGLCDSAQDILEELEVEYNEEDNLSDLEDDERRLYEAIKNGEDDMTIYCQKHSIKFFEIAPVLSSLEIQGLITKTAGNKYKPVK